MRLCDTMLPTMSMFILGCNAAVTAAGIFATGFARGRDNVMTVS